MAPLKASFTPRMRADTTRASTAPTTYAVTYCCGARNVSPSTAGISRRVCPCALRWVGRWMTTTSASANSGIRTNHDGPGIAAAGSDSHPGNVITAARPAIAPASSQVHDTGLRSDDGWADWSVVISPSSIVAPHPVGRRCCDLGDPPANESKSRLSGLSG